ncbi:hypothetical protein [Haliovirga abyssi]|uniref:Transposase (putative) YhgA-like domain-containing protein n=1 Tax=Haliovirga abyssi TaxID=2996794 RepID=A0AAU9D7G7_9FUSO|nr:hypothetical protein [Haliovirga abyssi]BDU50523.1 hypothetical protein HLVA_10920 [Haliovirga abyssi]
MKKYMPDILWKEIIEDLFEEFVSFFMTDLYPNIDFERGYEFLDKEVSGIFQKTRKEQRYADRIVKVYMKTGEENWILIHIEIQGYYEKEFSERMFKYFYRIYDKYNKKIVALSIFTDSRKGYEPNIFEYEFYRTKLRYEYISYKILKQREEELIKSNNPFAMVVLAGLYTIKSEGKELDRLKFKYQLTKLLLKKGYKREKIEKIFKFLDSLLYLPKELELEYEDEVKRLTGGEEQMGITMEMTNIYQVGIEQGIEQGIERGIEQGIEQGKNREKVEIAIELLKNGIDIKIISTSTGLSVDEIEKLKYKVH